MKKITYYFIILVLIIGVSYINGRTAVASVVNGYLNGDPNYPLWDGGSHMGEFVDLSSAVQDGNNVYVNIVIAGYHSGEIVETRAVKLIIASTHRIWASPKILFDPDSDYNQGDSTHRYRKLFWIMDEAIDIQR